MRPALIAATGLYTPPESITNAELVEAFNAYVARFNADNAEAIAQGRMDALEPSSAAFIEKASGITSRYVVEKSGTHDSGVYFIQKDASNRLVPCRPINCCFQTL